MTDLKFQLYGSASSIDLDIMVFVDSLGSIDDNKKTIEVYKERFKNLFPQYKCDVHLAVVKDGMIVDVSHGTYDECNNSLYYTYRNFRQPYPNAIERPYDRVGTDFYHIKMKRVARFILSFFSREPELRKDIKSALRGDLNERIRVLKLIDFTKHTEFPGKKERKEDIYKVCAFQFAQVSGLACGGELFTKEDVIHNFSVLADFILRKENITHQLYKLNSVRDIFVMLCEQQIKCGKLTNLIE